MKEFAKDKEKKVVEHLNDLQFDVDTSELWAQIEPQLEQNDRKRRPIAWLWWGTAGVLLLLAGSLMWMQKKAQSVDEFVAENTSREIITDQKIEINNNDENINNEAVKSNIEEQVKPVNNIVKNKMQLNKELNKSDIVLQEKPSQNLENIVDYNLKTKYNTTNTNVAKSLPNNILADINLSPTSHEQQEEVVSETATPIRSTLSAVMDVQSLLPLLDYDRVIPGQLIKPLAVYDRQLLLGVSLGANKNMSTITNNTSEPLDLSEYNYERDRLGLSGRLFIGVENRQGWRMKAGMDFHRYATSYERQGLVLVKDPVTGIIAYRIDEASQTSTTTGTTELITIRNVDLSWTRTHDALDLFASIGKRLLRYKGWSLYADVGASVNNYTSHSGYYIANEDFGFTKITDDNHPYRITTGWYTLANLDLSYSWNQWRIGVQPNIRWAMSSMTKRENYSQMKNSQTGIQLSMTYLPGRE